MSLDVAGGEERVCLLDHEDALVPGTMRATGDWVEVRDAQLRFLGRRDRLIKRHGKRVNLDSLQQVRYLFNSPGSTDQQVNIGRAQGERERKTRFVPDEEALLQVQLFDQALSVVLKVRCSSVKMSTCL